MTGIYTPPVLTVDSVIFQLQDEHLAVLLIKRANEPFQGQRALPGGYNPEGETTRQAMTRILNDKAGLDTDVLNYIEQLYTFDTIARDPRGHAVSVTYTGLGNDIVLHPAAASQQPYFFPLDTLPPLAYDHLDIIEYALGRLRSKLSYTNIIKALLPHRFTLSQLQSAYEIILGHTMDKRNFRKKYIVRSALSATGEYRADGAHRPAQLYAFKDRNIVIFSPDAV